MSGQRPTWTGHSGKGCSADRECGWAGNSEAAVGLLRRASLELGARLPLFRPPEQMQTCDPAELSADRSDPQSPLCCRTSLWMLPCDSVGLFPDLTWQEAGS